MGDWVQQHQQRLSAAYRTASQRMGDAASSRKQCYDQRANTLPLLPGERVWVRSRGGQGRGKLQAWWDPEPFVVLEQVGDTGVVYRIQPEKGGRERTIHRNSLKVCIAPSIEAPQVTTEPVVETGRTPEQIFYGFFPGPLVEEDPRRSTRSNLGQPPSRYRDLELR